MPQRMRPITLASLALATAAGPALAAPPPVDYTSVARSGNIIPGVGTISSATAFGSGQGPGILKVAVNNSGAWLVDAHVVQTDTNSDEALLRSATGLNPYIAEGIPGYLAVPTSSFVASGFHSLSLNAQASAGLAVGLFPDDFSVDMPDSGVYFNTTASPAREGAVISAAGLAPGTTWARFDANTRVQLNDANQMLVVSGITESGITRRAVIVLQLSPSGAVTGATLIAKEGGPVGPGPDTWTTIAGGGHASAMNGSGRVVFSGTTASGTDGIYDSGSGFIAVRNGPTPVAGITWGSLSGSPVAINAAGTIAFRAITGAGDGSFTEGTDAGELMDTAARTFGNGPLTRISGTLATDADVDMYRLRIDDPASFSATTVPDPSSGFPGAAFDTVLTLIAGPENGTIGLYQADNASPSVTQSTLTAPTVIAGREFYLCVSTPKSRPQARLWHYATGTFPDGEIWAPDPSGLAFGGGLVYWPDPSTQTVGRITPAGAVQSPLAIPAVATQIAVDAAGGKIYWIDRGAGAQEKIRRANLDGSNIQDLVTAGTFGSIAAYNGTGLALDLVNNKVYWSRSILGEINRVNLDGTSPERVIQDYPPTDAIYPSAGGALPAGDFAPTSLAVDPAGGKIYFVNTFLNRIQRANFNGTGRASLPVGAGAAQLALDLSAGKIYWTNTAGNKIQRSNLDGSGLEDVLSTPAPVAIALDTAGGFVYWSNTTDRTIRRATIAGASAALVTTIPAETGSLRADGPGAGSTFFEWTRTGPASTGPLPYQVRITGASFRHLNTMLVKGTQKVAAVGDVIPGTAPNGITEIGSPTSPIRLSDRGDLLWTGVFYQPTVYNNYLFDGLFFNGERLLASMDVVPGATINSQKLVNLYRGAYALDLSPSGEWGALAVNMQVPPYNFTAQPDNALLLHFTLPALCAGDFNNSGAVTVQDIFDFLAAYFSSDPRADVNHSGAVTVQDIFDFLSAYFAGC